MTSQSLSGAWQFRQAGSDEWLAARVPGGVHTDLMAAGRIADPFFGDEELRVQWVAEADWEYRRSFQVDPAVAAEKRLALVFDGLDTLADIRLNGEPLGSADNMFRTWRWDVTEKLRPGDNELAVVFHSAVRRGAELNAVRALDRPRETLPGAPYLRKAPCHFGWDWGPKLPNAGIWQDVRIEAWSVARLEDVRIEQAVDAERARAQIRARLEVERADVTRPRAIEARLRVFHPNGRIETVTAAIPAEMASAGLTLEIAGPELWWPNGLGEQPLYRIEVELARGDRTLDLRSYQVGLRTLELRRRPDEWGESFTFVVNGVPIFAKGSNWIPADSFPARVTPARLEALLGAAAATNHNMIRVWGGGYYETEAFYDLCDRHGILVWQDFMFACSVYPLTDREFVANLEVEVREQVRRLRHRACLALWCGNNEMERGWTIWGWSRPGNEDLRAAYLRFFSETLPRWIAAEDRATPYWPSSPSSGRPLEEPIGGNRGDEHEWIVWHALAPFSAYGHETYRFVSEFGFESLPALATVAAFAPDPADWNLGSPLLDHHQRCPVGNARILYYMAQQFRLPRDFPSLVYLSQILHAEAMRVGVEHWRRQRERCSGALYWQLDDCWPVSSWASIDYFGRWKALQYATRRFYAPVLISGEVEADGVSLAVTNDRAAAWQGDVRWSLERLDGEVVASGRESVEAPGLATTRVCHVAGPASIEDRRSVVLVAEMLEVTSRRASVVTTFVPDKHLALRHPSIDVQVQVEAAGADAVAAEAGSGAGAAAGAGSGAGAGRRAILRLRSDTLARWVELLLDGADVIFDDNYFDLPAGREVVVGFDAPEGWDIERVRRALAVRSVVDTYA
ncbi:MAG: glycoside hydrolase family 2 protein [Candidatus Limnocylindrales bacterium]